MLMDFGILIKTSNIRGGLNKAFLLAKKKVNLFINQNLFVKGLGAYAGL